MSDAGSTAARGAGVPVRVTGIVRGREFEDDATLELGDDGLLMQPHAGRRLRIPFSLLDGLSGSAGHLTLFLCEGDELAIDGPDRLAHLGRNAERAACRLPELTRRLGGFGSARAGDADEQALFFGPLLEARRRAERAGACLATIDAIDTGALQNAAQEAYRSFAARRCGAGAPERRALEAELQQAAEPYELSLTILARAAARVREAGDDERFVAWREWRDRLGDVFVAADRAWGAVLPALRGESVVRHGLLRPLLRRLLRRAPAMLATCALSSAIAAPRAQAQHLPVRVVGGSTTALLARGFDVIDTRGGDAIVVGDSVERARLVSEGFTVEIVARPVGSRMPAAGRATPTLPTVYRSFDDPVRGIRAFVDSLRRANPARVHVDTIGFSVEGRPLLVVKVGSADDSPSRPNVLYMATYHAREWAATETARRLLVHLVQPAADDARTRDLVLSRDVWIMPVANPDGYQYTFTTERLWRKNRRPVGTAVGVDLNRNHSSNWGYDDAGSSPNPRSEIYRGTAPASEPEIMAIERFHSIHPPVLSVSYHTFTGLLLYPPGYRYGLLPGDRGTYEVLAGTSEHPAVIDRLPGSPVTYYKPTVAWNLYTTNGEYTDWAYTRHGTLSFTPELTSGQSGNVYYGFEFPDDESLLQRLFLDNLPFALDVLAAAADPPRYRSPNTGLSTESIALESIAPEVRVRVPTAAAPITRIRANGSELRLHQDTGGPGTYSRRLVSDTVSRPGRLTVTAGAAAYTYTTLVATGAEAGDTAGWTATGFTTAPGGLGGTRAWQGFEGTLRSPLARIPADADTLSVVLWTTYNGDPFAIGPSAEIRISSDGGRNFTTLRSLSGTAPVFYTESVSIPVTSGDTVQLEIKGDGLFVRFDEIALVAKGRGTAPPAIAARAGLAPSANPVRSGTVNFAWPFAPSAGEVTVYDYAGRVVWRLPITPDISRIRWLLDQQGIADGVYVVVASSGGRVERLKLIVARNGR